MTDGKSGSRYPQCGRAGARRARCPALEQRGGAQTQGRREDGCETRDPTGARIYVCASDDLRTLDERWRKIAGMNARHV